MISAALAILETDEERNELSLIYESNIKTIYSVAFSKLHNVQDAEDAVQEKRSAQWWSHPRFIPTSPRRIISKCSALSQKSRFTALTSCFHLWGLPTPERSVRVISPSVCGRG